MKKNFTFLFCLSLIFFPLLNPVFAQGPGQPYYPETANGADGIFYFYHILNWQNPSNTVYNEIYLSYDSSLVAQMDTSVRIYNGYSDTARTTITLNQSLIETARYFWCVVEYGQNGFTQGNIWSFTTTSSYYDYAKFDDFSYGLGRWTITNSSGDCGFQIGDPASNDLIAPSTGNFLTANTSICGGSIISTATFQPADSMKYMYSANLEFNSHVSNLGSSDEEMVEMSTDNGSTWNQIWSKIGAIDENDHYQVNLFSENWFADTIYSVQVRFRIINMSGSGYWNIDNVAIIGYDGILTHVHPLGLHVQEMNENPPKVLLTWSQIISLPEQFVERKPGLPSDAGSYQQIATVTGNVYASYVDSTVNDSSIYTYRIKSAEGGFWNPWYVYSNESTAYVYTTVPVELTDFSANILDGKVKLNWSTSTETNNKGFEIERQVVSRQLLVGNWEKIGFVNGNGTTTELHNYSYIDNSNLSGKYKYRLKQIDFDGSFNYSNEIEIIISNPKEFSLEQNYPNPFNPSTKIGFRIAESGFVILKVYDVLGREVAVLVNKEMKPGNYNVKFDGSKYSSGIYLYKLSAEKYLKIKKMELIK